MLNFQSKFHAEASQIALKFYHNSSSFVEQDIAEKVAVELKNDIEVMQIYYCIYCLPIFMMSIQIILNLQAQRQNYVTKNNALRVNFCFIFNQFMKLGSV